MSEGIPCPLCGNGKLRDPPSLGALEDAATKYFVISRAEYEALLQARGALKHVHDRFPTSEGASALAALRAAGIQIEEQT